MTLLVIASPDLRSGRGNLFAMLKVFYNAKHDQEKAGTKS